VKKKTYIAIIIIIVLLALGYYAFTYQAEKETIKIGAILPLTGSAAELGDIKKNGMIIAAEEINEAGGIKGKQIRIIFEDSRNDATTGLVAMRKLIDFDKTPVIISAMSGVAMSLTSVANKEKIVLFANAGHPFLSKSGIYVFRNYPSTEIETKPMSDFILEKEPKQLSILVINDDYGIALKESLKNYLRNTSVKIVSEDVFDKNDEDFRSILIKTIEQKPEAIYLGGYGTAIGFVAKQLRELGFNGRILGSSGLLFPDVVKIAGEALESAVATSPGFNPESSDPYIKNFIDRYKKKFGEAPLDMQDAAMEYDSIKLIAEAIKKGGYSSDGIREALLSIRSFKGAMGELNVLPTRDIEIPIILKTIKNGNITVFGE